jgi:glycosyltransferase involved in cell wall biosynthesis
MGNASLIHAPLRPPAVALFSECYRPIVNGVVASIDALRAGLAAAGVDATLVAPYFPHARDDGEAVVRLPSLPLPPPAAYRLCLPFLPRAARVRLRDAAFVHAHSPFVTGALGAFIARRRGIPLIFTYHTRIDEYAHYAPFDPRIARAAMIALTRTFANRADVTIAPTHAMEARLRALGVHVPIAVVPSAIDVARFANARRTSAARALLGARDGERIVLCVSRLAKEKSLASAIAALAQTKANVRLTIVGDGPERSALQAYAADRGVAARVHFTGALEPAALPGLYAASDAFVFPSTTETQGLVLVEAMAAGLPVVAADTPVNREVLAGAGRLVPLDAARLAVALDDVLAAGRPGAPPGLDRRFGPGRHAEAVLAVYRAAAECRTFGTPRVHDTYGR